MSKRNIRLKDKLAYYLLKDVNKAIRDYEMIADGDRLAVAVSGGKDSLALLHLLRLRQRSVPENYTMVAVHVTTPRIDKMQPAAMDWCSTLQDYTRSQGLDCAFETIDLKEPPECFRCSYLRRKAFFAAAQRTGCNKIALGHHSDDAAQTTLLNLFFSGRVETLLPRRQFFGGKFVVIRPMIYLAEKDIARLAQACDFPLATSSCPRASDSRRVLVKSIISTLQKEFPAVKTNLVRAGLRGARP